MNTTQTTSTKSSSSTQALPLAGKVALVTGGSRGIGAGIVERLARDGAAVAFTYAGSRDRAEALAASITEKGGRAIAIQADSGDVDAVRRAVTRAVQAYDRLDILVNNAGVAKLGALTDLSLEDIDRMMAVNVRGLVVATQEALRYIKDGGRIINIGSVNSDSVPLVGASIYALTKGAVSAFTRGLARDVGPRGITVNDVQPGPIDTDMNPADGELAKGLTSLIAVQRYGKAREVAGLVAFLASEEGSFITGAELKVDGGFTA